jgi:hypothetical protein
MINTHNFVQIQHYGATIQQSVDSNGISANYPSVILNIEIVMTYTFNRPAFPATRMRRIRKNDQLRAMVSETHSLPIT